MKFIAIRVIAAAVLLASCGQKDEKATTAQPKPAVTSPAQPTETAAAPERAGKEFEVQPIDARSIKTIEDFESAKNAAFQRYEDRKNEAFRVYDDAKNARASKWLDARKALTMKLRAEDNATYLKWLDLREIGDYSKAYDLEQSSPALREYSAGEMRISKESDEADTKDYAVYERTDQNAYKVYETEEAQAWDAFEKNQPAGP